MPHDVFVSYASDDKPTADAVCATLENKGIRCWIAPRDILPGIDWGGAIVDAIHASRVMVLVYSAKANDSAQIKREVERAVNRGLTIIPFRIEDVPMSTTLEYFMSMPHWLDALTPPLQDHLDRLAETVRLILERAGAVLASPPGGQTTASSSPDRPLTTSGDIASRIGRWMTGGTESPTLAAMFVARSDRVATAAVIATGVVAISDPRPGAGRRDLVPAAGRASDGRRSGQSRGCSGGGYLRRPGDHRAAGFRPRGQCLDQRELRRHPYVRYGLGYVAGLTAAAFAVGWLSERRRWDRHRASAARLALAGIALMYIPGFAWLEVTALLMRETRGPAGVLPSIPMLVITVAVLALGLPRLWVAAAAAQRAASESTSAAVTAQVTPAETTNTRSPQ